MGIAMPKIFQEFAELHNATPRGRRSIGYVAGICAIACAVGLFLALVKSAGFMVLLVLAFFFLLCGDRYHYAFTKNLTQRRVRRMDYWYLGAVTIGLFLAALAYSGQRQVTISKFSKKFYAIAEGAYISDLNESMAALSQFLCVETKNAKEACAGLKKVVAEIQGGRTPAQIASIDDDFKNKVIVPSAHLFPSGEISKNPELFKPIVSVEIGFDNWKSFAGEAPKPLDPRFQIGEEMEIMFQVGQWVVWPFFLALALALRITKVTIDVFEWAK
jgi:hypothetical protein